MSIGVLPGFRGAKVDEGVPMIGRSIDDDIDVLTFENFSEVGRSEGGRAILGVFAGERGSLGFFGISRRAFVCSFIASVA
jgi:hypothetical protein